MIPLDHAMDVNAERKKVFKFFVEKLVSNGQVRVNVVR